MDAGSQKVFSVRLVSIDYYMSPPIPGVDISYSSFQGGKVNEVPVIRVYGSTPVGQKACLHIHKAFPYLYVPCSDAKLDAHREGEAYANSVAHALEKALKLKGGAGSKRQHVHGCNLVRAKKLYGYHSSEELFVKIYLYYPQDVSRAANLLLGGAVLEKSLQPHESHIPFILQFMVDYNLYGMGHVHLSKMKFRNPVPDVFTARKFSCSEHQGLSMDRLSCQSVNVKADMGGHGCLDSLFWVSSIIPDDWMWHVTSDIDASSVQQIERQSVCELEGDATVDEIINQQFQTYTSLSQTCSNMKMVQSLIPIWEEEYERTGLREATIPPDHGKPLPKDVLKTLLNSLEFEMKLQELCFRTEDNLLLSDSIVRSLQSGTSSTDKGSLVGSEIVDHINANEQSTEADICQFQGSVCEEVAATAAETIDACAKAADTEVLGLLRWLAASQAAEDINSDDELVRDTILSPLLPATSMDKVLEKANTDYESESQKECQDILESIEDLSVVECLKEESPLVVHDHHHETSLKKQSPQVNGLNSCLSRTGTLSKVDIEGDSKRHPQPVLETTPINLVNISKRKNPLWGSLPFTMTKKVDAESEAFNSHDTHPVMTRNEEKACSEALLKSMSSGVHESSTLVGCSLRDLMRKKRRLQVAEQDNVDKNVLSGEQEEGGALLPKRLDFHPPHCDENEKPVASRTSGSSVANLLVEFHDDGASSPSDFLVPKSDNCTISSDNPSEEKGAVGKNSLPAYPIVQENFAAGNSSDRQFDVNGRSYEDKLFVVHDENPLGLNESADNTLLHNENFYDSKQAEDDGFPWSPAHEMVSIEGKPSIGDFDGKEGVRRNSFQNDNNIQQESVMVPTHYQNDGTLLYLLTPSSSPPSAHTVSRWLFQDHQDAPGEINAALSEPLSAEGSSEIELHSSSSVDHNDVFIESISVSHCIPILDEVQQDKGQKYKQEVQFCNNDGQSKLQVEENDAKLNGFTNYSVDVSQISGPDGRSEPTPLSQIGFRDPASVGAGQQLTLLSLEVLAETRGDLRPDPRFDAINLIVLVFQFDNDSGVEAYVLLRSNSDSYQKNSEGVSGCEVFIHSAEKNLFNHFVRIINSYDPDMLMGWDVQGGSLGFLAERALHLGIGLLSNISRTPLDTNIVSGGAEASDKGASETELQELLVSSSPVVDQAVIQDEWGRTHASGVHVGGRVVLNLWRLMRGEVKLNMYNIEAVSEAVLRQKIPLISNKVLTRWFSSGTARARYRCIEYMTQRAKLNLEIMNQLDMVNRTSELARVFGIDFFSVLSRGSQYRVESMLLRLAHTQNYLAISPGSQQVASQPAMECLPLVMEPESRFYADPVVVLDFQSLYPSMIIAYNLCFSTCLGNVSPEKSNTLGVSAFSVDPLVLRDLIDKILLTPNGVMYVPAKVRKGVLPRLLEEILSTRIMVKQAMKKLAPSEQVLHRIFNARQLALKLIANVTYGYTAAGFSGRMPCAELADSIVQCGRCTLERAIALVNANDNWKAKVIYGDTDSMFVLLKGRSVQESFQIGHEIASAVTAMNPDPVTLKLEKVYHPCFLLTKKRYVGYSYESADQFEPIFDAKGIETVRRDTCGAVAKIMEKSLRLFFEHQDISEVKAYLQRQWKRIVSGRVSLQDFIFAKEVRLGTYSAMVSSSLPPAAIVATKAMRVDPRAEPRYAERVPYVVIHGEPGARLVDMVVDPLDLLAFDSPYRLNDVYYITKQIIPALQRVFGLVGADLNQWFSEMPRPVRESFAKRPFYAANSHRTRIDYYYMSEHCVLCGELVHGSAHLCNECLQNETSAATTVIGRTSKLEREMQHLAAICRHCGGGDWIVESGVKCTSLACSVFYERRKLQKELQGISAVAADKGFYPKCMVEWF